MMISYEYLTQPIKYDDTNINILVIENKELFRKSIISLLQGNEEQLFIFSDNYKEIDFQKEVHLISDPININLHDKKILTKINNFIETIANDEYYAKVCEIKEIIINLGEKLIQNMDYDIEYTGSIDTSEIIKLLMFKPRYEKENNYLETLVQHIRLLNQYLKIKCIVIVNLLSYISKEEYIQFWEMVNIHHNNILLIENKIEEKISNTYIVDKDLCEIIE